VGDRPPADFFLIFGRLAYFFGGFSASRIFSGGFSASDYFSANSAEIRRLGGLVGDARPRRHACAVQQWRHRLTARVKVNGEHFQRSQ